MVNKEITKIKKDRNVYSEATSKSPDRSGSSFSMNANAAHSSSFIQKQTPYINANSNIQQNFDYNGNSSNSSKKKQEKSVLRDNNGKTK